MLTAEYDYEMDMQVNREEAREEGWRKGWSNGWNKGILYEKISSYRKMYTRQIPAADIADMLEEPLDFVKKIFTYFKNHPEWDDQTIVEKLTGEGSKEIIRREQ